MVISDADPPVAPSPVAPSAATPSAAISSAAPSVADAAPLPADPGPTAPSVGATKRKRRRLTPEEWDEFCVHGGECDRQLNTLIHQERVANLNTRARALVPPAGPESFALDILPSGNAIAYSVVSPSMLRSRSPYIGPMPDDAVHLTPDEEAGLAPGGALAVDAIASARRASL